jgi:alcohol dehydrogenase class IV
MIEAYVSKKANLYSDTQAFAAMKLIGPNLKKSILIQMMKLPENINAGCNIGRDRIFQCFCCLGSWYEPPIGAFFHVPHGLSNAMLLPMITEYSIEAAPERYADCAKAMGVQPNDSVDLPIQTGCCIKRH